MTAITFRADLSKFERELRQAEYELEQSLEDAIIDCKYESRMSRTSFYNMIHFQQKKLVDAGIGTPRKATEHLIKCMRIWDMESER